MAPLPLLGTFVSPRMALPAFPMFAVIWSSVPENAAVGMRLVTEPWLLAPNDVTRAPEAVYVPLLLSERTVG
jgi:hypothetical protein